MKQLRRSLSEMQSSSTCSMVSVLKRGLGPHGLFHTFTSSDDLSVSLWDSIQHTLFPKPQVNYIQMLKTVVNKLTGKELFSLNGTLSKVYKIPSIVIVSGHNSSDTIALDVGCYFTSSSYLLSFYELITSFFPGRGPTDDLHETCQVSKCVAHYIVRFDYSVFYSIYNSVSFVVQSEILKMMNDY